MSSPSCSPPSSSPLLAWRRRQASRVTVWQWQAGLLFRDGRFQRVLPPGRHVSGIGGLHVGAVSLNPRTSLVSGQEALTRDGFPVRLSANLAWHVTDAPRFYAANGGSDAYAPEPLLVAAQTALRRVISGHDLDGLLALRAEGAPLDEALRAPIAAVAATLGAELEAVTLRDLHLPAEIRRMITEVERARREGLAALERARGSRPRSARSPTPRACSAATRNSRLSVPSRPFPPRPAAPPRRSSSAPARSCRSRSPASPSRSPPPTSRTLDNLIIFLYRRVSIMKGRRMSRHADRGLPSTPRPRAG
ncbi:SPFH domain-containing protein [Roseomonas sp. CCTCC AB2023176]|uniref:SPFH domain-containing protein n=1 Tax=Roseomonas sp. CCTCC AB2023176 TaxID=3342640 RepID=UPI0035DCEB0D